MTEAIHDCKIWLMRLYDNLNENFIWFCMWHYIISRTRSTNNSILGTSLIWCTHLHCLISFIFFHYWMFSVVVFLFVILYFEFSKNIIYLSFLKISIIVQQPIVVVILIILLSLITRIRASNSFFAWAINCKV